jgi:hypothetical protein
VAKAPSGLASLRDNIRVEPALILANRILQLIRESGAGKTEAYCALEVAHKVLPSLNDIGDPPAILSSEDAVVG